MELNDGYDRAIVVMHGEGVVEVILTNHYQLIDALYRACRSYLGLDDEMPNELVEAAYRQSIATGNQLRILPVGTVTKEQYE